MTTTNKTISMLVILVATVAVSTLGIQAASADNNGFSDAVKDQAQNQERGSFGQHQSEFAKGEGLGQYNCNTCTPLKGQ